VLERVRPPARVPASRWRVDPREADEDGIVGVGADLDPATLVAAYRAGVFPWPHARGPLPWFSPDPRAVIDPRRVRVPRSLRQRLRSSGWTTTMDRDLPAVMAGCAERPEGEGTWITPAMRAAYERLWTLGWARSLEVWEDGRLVGGLYGVQVGGVLTGESMFHRRRDASKVALVDLGARFAAAGGELLDVQLETPHLRALGAVTVPRAEFLGTLVALRDRDVRPVAAELPVARLATGAPTPGRT
jgi:leucyl/phenylalanyl-tRNA--protein transferase